MTLTLEMIKDARDKFASSTNQLPPGEYYVYAKGGYHSVRIADQPEWVEYLRSRGFAVQEGAWY
jgi:hypothetical protein